MPNPSFYIVLMKFLQNKLYTLDDDLRAPNFECDEVSSEKWSDKISNIRSYGRL